MNETLSKYGFVYSGICNCDGYTTKKYSLGLWQVRTRGERVFQLRHNQRKVTRWLASEQLNDTILNHVQTISKAEV